jgi:hypothetical protein
MIFWMGSKRYCGSTAVEIARGIELDATGYPKLGGTVRDFISWSLLQLSDRLPLRELAVSDMVSEETLALGYLCLLDQYSLGELHLPPDRDESGTSNSIMNAPQ